jgi:hypothetical protein
LLDDIVIVLGLRRREYLCELFRIGREVLDNKVTGQRLRDFAYDLGIHIPIRAKTVEIATGICPRIHGHGIAHRRYHGHRMNVRVFDVVCRGCGHTANE